MPWTGSFLNIRRHILPGLLAAIASPMPALATSADAAAPVLSPVPSGVPMVQSQPTVNDPLPPIVVTAARRKLLGTAASASEGVVSDKELRLTPAYRPGQLLETVPGLIVTLHSGEGKANQYLLRGYNLDHGTDLATWVDGMPINQPTHAHGQGYTDLNFLMPELANAISYTKGPYYAPVGDFGAVGSLHIDYRHAIPNQIMITGGSYGFGRVLATGSQQLAGGQLLAAGEYQHVDGPFDTADNARKENAVLRYSGANGFSITGMFYHQDWTNTTDIPLRAIATGRVPDRFGSLDPSDGGHAWRASLSANYTASLDTGTLMASGFYIYNRLHIFNDFTHFLIDPVHGDQEDQFENRHVFGGAIDYAMPLAVGGIASDIKAGGLGRLDLVNVGRLPSQGQKALRQNQVGNDPPSFSNNDNVTLLAVAVYLEATTHWTGRFRSVLGIRGDFQRGTDTDNLASLHALAGYSNGGTRAQLLLQPKGSLIYAPIAGLELYGSAGQGFHSADLRGVNQTKSIDLGLPGTPLLARQVGEELGLRGQLRKNLTLTFAVYNLWQRSETIINPDVGQDIAGPPSRRYGYEINLTWQLNRWLEFYGSFSGDHTRFTRPFDDGTGHLGTYIANAPVSTGSFALYLDHLGPWSGGVQYRYLGHYALSSGLCNDTAAARDFPGAATSCATAPTAPGQIDGKGFGQVNLDIHYAFQPSWEVSVGLYNALNTHAAAAEFWYVDRLAGEVAGYPDGRADIHQHPLEPRMLRVSLARNF